MTTEMLNKKTQELEREVELLRSFVIGHIAKDSEGDYKPDFVQEALLSLSNEEIEHTFTNKEDFLAYLSDD